MNFEHFVLINEPVIRMGFFFGVFALVALWELASPRRVLKLSRKQRWTANLGIVVLNTLVVRLLFPAAAVGMAALGAEKGWGLLTIASSMAGQQDTYATACRRAIERGVDLGPLECP